MMEIYDNYERIAFFDLETSIKNVGDTAVGDHKASPYHPNNRIVWSGLLCKNTYFQSPKYRGIIFNDSVDLIVAQNIAFDLSYLLDQSVDDDGSYSIAGEENLKWIKNGGEIWDVMIVEYLLTGQELKFASLDELATIYGGELKDSRIKEYWDNGISTEDIPSGEILPYLESDVRNLEIIYKGQLAKAKALGMLPLIRSQMEARLCTILMEVNGMKFDTTLARKKELELIAIRDKHEEYIKELMHERCKGVIPKDQLNPSSSVQMSAIFFSGLVPITEIEVLKDELGQPVVYKSGAKKGQVKTRKVRKQVEVSPNIIYANPSVWKSEKGRSGYYSTGVDTLKVMMKGGDDELAEALLDYRELTKQINTYFSGYRSLTWPDGLIHGSINHCQTNTGRLSSSKPNLQNISNRSTEL